MLSGLYFLFALLFCYIFIISFYSVALHALLFAFYSVCSSITFFYLLFCFPGLHFAFLFIKNVFCSSICLQSSFYFLVFLCVHVASRFFCRRYFCPVFHLLYLCKEHYTNSICFIYGLFHVFALSEAPSEVVVSSLSYGTKSRCLKNFF